jgi:phosphatidylglycerol lysyltransferase
VNTPKHLSPQTRFWSKLVAIVVGLSGLLHLLIALHPPRHWMIDQLENWTPFHIALGSQALLLLSACGQLALGRGLWRRKQTAWWGTLIVLLVTPLLHVGHDFAWRQALVSLLPLGLLIWQHRHFSAKSDRGSLRWAWIIGGPTFVALLIFGYFAVQHFSVSTEGNHSVMGTLQAVLELVFLQSTDTLRATTQQAQTVFFVVSFSGGAFGLFILSLVLRPVFPERPPSPVEQQRVRRIIDEHGGNPFDEFALAEDKHYYFSSTNRSVVVFALWRNYALTLSDPIGPDDERGRVIAEFIAYCVEQDWEPVLYEVGPDHLALYEELGFKCRKIGEQARIPLATYVLKGARFQDLRTACNRAGREGFSFRWYPSDGPVDKAIEAGLRQTSDAWLHAKHGREMAFDMGHFDLDEIRLRGAAVALNPEGRVEAFATWLPYKKDRGRCIDLMRHRSSMPGLMDFVITESIKTFQARGLEEVCLANAPLANTTAPENTHDHAMRYIYQNFNRLYGYKSLFEFKKKYQPAWRGSYLAYRSTAKLPWIGYAMVSIHVPGGLWKLLRS